MGNQVWRVRMGWECRGYMYYVDVCEHECLDVARGLWLTGADYVCLWASRFGGSSDVWKYTPRNGAYRGATMGGYSKE